MSLFQRAIQLTAKYGGVARVAVKHVVNLVPGGSLVTATLDQVLESVHDHAKQASEEQWRKETESRLQIGEKEQQNLSQLIDVLTMRMDDLLQTAIKWDGQPELESKLEELLQQQPDIRRAFHDIETITQHMEVMAQTDRSVEPGPGRNATVVRACAVFFRFAGRVAGRTIDSFARPLDASPKGCPGTIAPGACCSS